MAKKIHQFTSIQENTNILVNYTPVVKLGIQGPEGTTFQINDGSDIKIGKYLIYELDLTGLGGQIYSLKFKEGQFLDSIIVDIVYEGGNS